MSRNQLLTPSLLRTDSRLPLELRALSLSLIPVPPSPSSPDGHATVTHGLTRVDASVFGPREPSRGTAAFVSNSGGGGSGGQKEGAVINVEVGVPAWSERGQASTAGGIRKGNKDRRATEIATTVVSTFTPVVMLHLYPRSSIDIFIQIHSVDGCSFLSLSLVLSSSSVILVTPTSSDAEYEKTALLQAAINATTLALIAAGIPLTDYIISLSLASYPSPPPPSLPIKAPFELSSPSSSTPLLDLTQVEEQSLPNLTVGVLPRSGKVVLVALETRLDVNRFEELLRWGVEGSKVIQGAMESAVREWARSLAEPRKGLANLFPGIGGDAKQRADGDDEGMEDY